MANASLFRSFKLVAFVSTCEPARAKAFYRDTLGLSLVSEDRFAIVFDANGTTLRIAIVEEVITPNYTVLTQRANRSQRWLQVAVSVWAGKFPTSLPLRKISRTLVSNSNVMTAWSRTSSAFGRLPAALGWAGSKIPKEIS